MAAYLDLNALLGNADFTARVKIAVATFAKYKLDEDPATAGHSLAVKWAQNAVANPGTVAAGILPSVVLDDAIQAKASMPADITDVEVQAATEAALTRILNS